MRIRRFRFAVALSVSILVGCSESNVRDIGVSPVEEVVSDDSSVATTDSSPAITDEQRMMEQYHQRFEGHIARSYEESEAWWPPAKKAPEGAPNVLLILLDDTGYSHFGSFGGLIPTPNMDRLADNGLRYNNFHTTALCSPSRAAIMAGRNPHSIGLGSHSLTAMGFPGYNAMIPPSAQSVARILQEHQFVNYAIGKWDHTPLYEVSQLGPFDHWPNAEGFDHFYGFMAADVHNMISVMWEDHSPAEPSIGDPDYHLTTDMADRANLWITGHESIDPSRPWMMFFAPGAMHAPHHAPDDYLERERGNWDQGWDVVREQILARQLELGIIPPGTQLSPRIEEIPAWDSLDEEHQRMYARQMEAFAAMLRHTDDEIGRVIATLERIGELDNTLILVTSDNGASGEGGLAGTFNETYVLNGLQTPFDANLRHFDTWGTATTYPHYHAGWAMAGNTPFRYFKQSVHNGGIADALIVHWPDGIESRGEIRGQYLHISDIAPTILEVTGAEFLEEIDGVEQQPFDGHSFANTFNDPDAPNSRDRQYYEMFGNRAIWMEGWKAVSLHGQRMPWITNSVTSFEEDVWELYHVAKDFSESVNLADQEPERLAKMIAAFDEEAWRYNVYPLYDDMIARLASQQDRLFGDEEEFVYFFPGAVRLAEKVSAPVKGRSHTISTTIDLTGEEEGVIVACGGMTGGYTMFIQDGELVYDYNYLDGVYYELRSGPLPVGTTSLEFRFECTAPFSGVGHLWVNGERVDEVEMPAMHFSTYSLQETFDIGQDTGTNVSRHYDDNFHFTGSLDRVVINVPQVEE